MNFKNIKEYLDFAKFCRSCQVYSKDLVAYTPSNSKTHNTPIKIIDDELILQNIKININSSCLNIKFPQYNQVYLDSNCVSCESFTKSDAIGRSSGMLLFSDFINFEKNIILTFHSSLNHNNIRYIINNKYNIYIDNPDFTNKELLLKKIKTIINFS